MNRNFGVSARSRVKYLLNHPEQVWLDDLLESKPDERKAVMASFGLEEEATEATPETASTAPAIAETAQPETKSAASPAASPAVLTSAEVTSTSAVIEQPKPAPVAEAVKAIEAKKESKIRYGQQYTFLSFCPFNDQQLTADRCR